MEQDNLKCFTVVWNIRPNKTSAIIVVIFSKKLDLKS